MNIINLYSNTAKRRAVIFLDKIMAVLDRAFTRRMWWMLNSQFREAALFYEKNMPFEMVIDNDYDNMMKIFIRFFTRVSKVFSDIIFQDMEKSIINYEQKTARDVFWMTMRVWMGFHAAERVVIVNETTKKVIRGIITKGITDGIGKANIVKEMRKKTGLNKYRANRIARTEIHTAASKSMFESMNSFEKPIVSETIKIWMAVGDKRTRDWHLRADGQQRKMKQFFDVMGEQLEYPGAENGSAANIIMCRCQALYSERKLPKTHVLG